MLQIIVDELLYGLLKLDPLSKLVKALNYFLYDSIKIIFLLFVMIAFIGFLRSYIPIVKLKKVIAGKKSILGNFISSLFGAITPFCSCSSIPIFLSFLKSGIPLGVAYSFLITSPIVNEYLVVLMLGFFGWKITAIYVLFGIMTGVVSGYILGKMNINQYISKDFIYNSKIDKDVKI
jgi:uncharacterized membrane protein YraQ (UPF0718 family)